MDRADIKQYIGLPPPEANHWILSGCLNEMMKRGLMEPIVRVRRGRVDSTRGCVAHHALDDLALFV